MKKILLCQQGKNKGKYIALVDDEDYDYLNQWRWCVVKVKNTEYVMRREYSTGKCYFMHRILMNTPDYLSVDHIDHNGLNNQKSNLRNCTHQQNRCNTNYPSKNKYKGVTRVNNRFRAIIQPIGVRIHLGYFDTEMDAARAYDEAAKKYFGEFANLNFK